MRLRFGRPWGLGNRIRERDSVLECGGKRSATPLSSRCRMHKVRKTHVRLPKAVSPMQACACIFLTALKHMSPYTFTHPFDSELSKIASQSLISWCPSSAVANSTGVCLPLAMCS